MFRGSEIFRSVVGAFGLFLLLSVAPAQGASLEAYGVLPSLENIVVSPAGDRVAYVRAVGGNRVVVIKSFPEGQALGGLNVGDQKVRDLRWADDDHLLVTKSVTSGIPLTFAPRGEWFIATSFDVRDRSQRQLLHVANGVAALNILADNPESRIIDGKTTVFVKGIYFPNDQSVIELFDVDLGRDRATPVMGSPTSRDWLIDARGNAVAEADYRENSKHWSLRTARGGVWSEAFGLDTPIDKPELIGLSPDARSILVQLPGNEHSDRDVKLVSLADGSVAEAPAAFQGFESFVVDQTTGETLAGVTMGMRRDYVFFDPRDRSGWTSIVDAFSGGQVDLVSSSVDHKKVVVKVFGPSEGVNYQLVDLDTGRGTDLGPVYDGLGANDVAPVAAISYPAADGFDVPAYLTLPRGREAKGLPLIVLPHGGPAARDGPGFDWWAQALASRGYAVLQPQFRGSDGFGWKHLSAGFGQWGRKMQFDLSDGVRALAAKGIVDPKRVCIVGGSYGGYAALAGAALDRGVYRCAVSVAGLSDLRAFLSWQVGRSERPEFLRYWRRFMGADDDSDPALDRISPAKFADKVDVPILLIHGRDDTIVPIAQSQEMADALKAAGKPVTFLELASEDHWLSRSETRLQMLKATVDFLETNNPP